MKRIFSNRMRFMPSLSFALVLTMSLSVILGILWQLDELNNQAFKLILDANKEAEYSYVMRDSVRQRELSIQRMLNLNDLFEIDEEFEFFKEQGTRFLSAREGFVKLLTDEPEIQDLYQRIQNQANYNQAYHERVIEALQFGDMPKSELKVIVQQGASSQHKLVELLDRLVEQQQNIYTQAVNQYQQSRKNIWLLTAAIYLVSIVVAILVVRFSTRRFSDISRLSISDALTDVYNRRYFDMIIEDEWHRSMRDDTPLSLLMLDIDFFKAYNDEFGHQKGDYCLRSVATVMAGELKRATDILARYGGEEFVVILPNTDAAKARLLAEHLRRSVENTQLKSANDEVSPWVTISVGVATAKADKQTSHEVLIEAADQNLYKSKTHGRNRVSASVLSLDESDRPAEKVTNISE